MLTEKKRVGRPRKTDLVKPGRPKGEATIMKEYKRRMIASPKSRKVLDTIFEAALDSEHKHQAAAWKLVMDRVLPVGMFEQEVMKDTGRGAIQINITTVDDPTIKGETYEGTSSVVTDTIDSDRDYDHS